MKEFIKKLLREELSVFDDFPVTEKHTIKLDNELGRGFLTYGNYSFNDAIRAYGYKPNEWDELDYGDKRYILKRAKELPQMEIQLKDWRANEVGNGFGKTVLNTIFDLANKLKIDRFDIILPSAMATEILKHWVDKGVLKQIYDYQYQLLDRTKL